MPCRNRSRSIRNATPGDVFLLWWQRDATGDPDWIVRRVQNGWEERGFRTNPNRVIANYSPEDGLRHYGTLADEGRQTLQVSLDENRLFRSHVDERRFAFRGNLEGW